MKGVDIVNYFLIGLLISIGWGIGRTITCILDEVAFESLHRFKPYRWLIDKTKSKNKNNSYHETKIGF